MKPVLEYHKFSSQPDVYQYSRTYAQFEQDLSFKNRFAFRFDDGHAGQLLACEQAREHSVNVVVGITTNFVETVGYLTWEQLRFISQFHTLANHSVKHEHLRERSIDEIVYELEMANDIIERNTGLRPTLYLPTYNEVNQNIIEACKKISLKIFGYNLKIMYNDTVL